MQLTLEAVNAMSPAERQKAFPTKQIKVSRAAIVFMHSLAADVKAGRMTSTVAEIVRRHTVYSDAKGRVQLRANDTALAAITAELTSKKLVSTTTRATPRPVEIVRTATAPAPTRAPEAFPGLTASELDSCRRQGLDPARVAASLAKKRGQYAPVEGLTASELDSCVRQGLNPTTVAANLAVSRARHAKMMGKGN